MGASGLKLKIFMTLVVLLAAGMLLVDMVAMTLWRRDLVLRERQHVRALLTVASAGRGRMPVVARLVDARCGVFFVPGNGVKALSGLELCPGDPVRVAARRAAISGRDISRVVGKGGLPFFPDRRGLIVAVPVRAHGRIAGSIAVMIPLAAIYSSIRGYERIILVSLLVNLIVLSVVGLFRFLRSTVRPIENLVSLAESYSEDDSLPFLMLDGGDEFGQLSGALNRMLGRIEDDKEKLRATVRSLEEANRELRNTQQEMVRTEKLASIGRLAAGMAHEIGNPLGIVQGYMGLLKMRNLSVEERFDYAGRAEQELQRVNSLIRQLLDFSRASTGQRQQVSLHEILSSLESMVRHQPFLAGVELICSFGAVHDTVLANPDQLMQVFLNCLMNSADAIVAAGREEGRITISTRSGSQQGSDAAADQIVVSITDNGEGIREEDLANVLDPFFTTKAPGKGTGLGLSVSHSIVTGHGGSMVIRSIYTKETTIEIRLPLMGK